MKALKWIIVRNVIANLPVNIADICAAEDIFGPDEGSLCGNTLITKYQ